MSRNAQPPALPNAEALADDVEVGGEAVRIRDGQVQLRLDLRSYRLVAIQKASYRLADKFTVVLGTEADGVLPVTLLFATGTTDRDANVSIQLFYREVLDQELREHIGDETRAVRNLILAHAFSKTDLVGR